jgi:phosphatidylglycerophosphatase GEP4
VPYER